MRLAVARAIELLHEQTDHRDLLEALPAEVIAVLEQGRLPVVILKEPLERPERLLRQERDQRSVRVAIKQEAQAGYLREVDCEIPGVAHDAMHVALGRRAHGRQTHRLALLDASEQRYVVPVREVQDRRAAAARLLERIPHCSAGQDLKVYAR